MFLYSETVLASEMRLKFVSAGYPVSLLICTIFLPPVQLKLAPSTYLQTFQSWQLFDNDYIYNLKYGFSRKEMLIKKQEEK